MSLKVVTPLRMSSAQAMDVPSATNSRETNSRSTGHM
jgi:hypothetical protein